MSSQAIPPLPSTPHWQALAQHWQAISPLQMRDLFREDPGRFTRFSIEAGPLLLDYSKNRITADTLPLLTALARAARQERGGSDCRAGGGWACPYAIEHLLPHKLGLRTIDPRDAGRADCRL